MKSTRSRSRSKNNRNRNSNQQGGNVVNRVFDSSGPEGKVRGTPGQIIEKYNQLARDAQLSNDRVAMENFQQHAEHYLRLLAGAQKEMDAKREEQERQNRERQAERDRERAERQEREGNQPQPQQQQQHQQGESEQPGPQEQPHDKLKPQRKPRGPKAASTVDQLPDFVTGGGAGDDADSGLVETPESKPKRAPRRKPRPAGDGNETSGPSEAAE